jgi:hypothetical protein
LLQPVDNVDVRRRRATPLTNEEEDRNICFSILGSVAALVTSASLMCHGRSTIEENENVRKEIDSIHSISRTDIQTVLFIELVFTFYVPVASQAF